VGAAGGLSQSRHLGIEVLSKCLRWDARPQEWDGLALRDFGIRKKSEGSSAEFLEFRLPIRS
jgi:hypothetical protein